jgi:hypothetical protein
LSSPFTDFSQQIMQELADPHEATHAEPMGFSTTYTAADSVCRAHATSADDFIIKVGNLLL